MKKFTLLKTGWVTILYIVVYTSCKSTIALYDQYAYTQATSLKVDLQNLADESVVASYKDAKADITKLNTELEKDYEYVKGLPKNSLSTKQYEILRSDKDFYKSFLRDWEKHEKLSDTEATEIKKEMGKLMDQVIELESGKNKKG